MYGTEGTVSKWKFNLFKMVPGPYAEYRYTDKESISILI